MDDTRNSTKYNRKSAPFPRRNFTLQMVFSSKYLQGEDNNISLPPVRGKCKIQDIFVLREKNKAPAYLVLQHREFCCPDGDQEPPGCS